MRSLLIVNDEFTDEYNAENGVFLQALNREMMLDELYWLLKVGRPKRRLSVFQLRNELNNYIQKPVFVLSTGRCGTKWFSDLFAKDRSLSVFHAPTPNLSIQGKFAWEIEKSSGMKLSSMSGQLLAEIFFSGREQHLRYTAKAKKRYVETNNYITFFAPVLAEIFPDAKFVHIVRNPVAFIRSGLDRSYYSPGNTADIKRIRGNAIPSSHHWENLSRYGKIAWLWNETNDFIESFSRTIPQESFKTFRFDLSDSDGLIDMMQFLEANITSRQINTMQQVKKNVQKNRTAPEYKHWDRSYQEEVKSICSVLAAKYDFQL